MERLSRVESLSEVKIDGNIWQNLPEHLLVSVLTRLPMWANFQLRRVCKHWNTTLRCLAFLRECPGTAPREEPFCVMAIDTGCSALYSPAVRKWSEFPQAWLSGNNREGETPTTETFEVVGAAGGLLLVQGKPLSMADEYAGFDSEFDSSDEDEAGLAGLAFINSKRKESQKGRRSLSLFNPLNKSRKQLPLPKRLERRSTGSLLGIGVNSETGTHKIIMAHRGSSRHPLDPEKILQMRSDSEESDDDEAGDQSDIDFFDDDDEDSFWNRRGLAGDMFWTICCYDLQRDKWDLAFRAKREYDHILLNGAVVGKDTYLLMLKLMRELGMYVPTFRVFKAPWQNSADDTIAVPDNLGFAKIFESHGCLMLAGWTDPQLNDPKVALWELRMISEQGQRSHRWVEVLEMPSKLVEQVYRYQPAGICFDAEGDYVCFSNHDMGRRETVTITCNIIKGEWKLCPSQIPESLWVYYGPRYLFEPKLEVVL